MHPDFVGPRSWDFEVAPHHTCMTSKQKEILKITKLRQSKSQLGQSHYHRFNPLHTSFSDELHKSSSLDAYFIKSSRTEKSSRNEMQAKFYRDSSITVWLSQSPNAQLHLLVSLTVLRDGGIICPIGNKIFPHLSLIPKETTGAMNFLPPPPVRDHVPSRSDKIVLGCYFAHATSGRS